MQSGSPLTVAGPCWLCPAAACGRHTSFPYIQGRPARLIAFNCSCSLLSPPFRLLAHPHRSNDPAHIYSTTKNPNPPRKIGVLIPKLSAKPAPRSTLYAARPPFPSEGHQHLRAGQVSWLAAYFTLCAFPSNQFSVLSFGFRVLKLDTQNSQLETITLDSGVQQISTPLTVAGQQRPGPPHSGYRTSPFSLFPPSADPAPPDSGGARYIYPTLAQVSRK